MADSPHEPRQSPLWPSVTLLVGFVALIVVGVLTVLLPELRDEADSNAPQTNAEPAEAPRPAAPDGGRR